MASVYRRRSKKTGKLLDRWSYSWTDADGRRRSGTGSVDKSATLRIAQRLETEAALVKGGVIDRKDNRAKEAGLRPILEHIGDYGFSLVAKGDTPKHVKQIGSVLIRLCEAARISTLTDLDRDRVQMAVSKIKAATSARTANHAIGSLKSFLRWCEQGERITALPGWLKGMKGYNERTDRKRVRRSLTGEELVRLLEVTEASTVLWLRITGPERAALYRLACCTGLRANELRTLEPDAFRLTGDDPVVIVRAAYSKHRREDLQPLRRVDANWFARWLESREGKPVVRVPEKTARMLRHDLEAAGIPYETTDGVVDFHALRATYITLLAQSGVDPKRLQMLARHSTITLTLDRYVKTTLSDLRDALEGKEDS